MNSWRLQSSTGRVLFKAYLSSDHLSPATGKTIAVVLSKNGGAFGNPNAGASNATEIANGWYYFTPAAQDRDTVGPVVWRGTEGTIDPTETEELVVDSVRLGITALPNAVPGANGGLPTVDASNRVAGIAGTITTLDGLDTAQDAEHASTRTRLPAALVSGRIDAHAGSVADGVLTAAKFAAGAFDAVWSVASRLLTAGTNIVLAKGTGVTGFNDLSAGDVRTALGMAVANLDTQLAALASMIAGISSPSAAAIRAEMDANSTQLAAIRADTEDLQAQVGVDGAGLTAIGDARLANLDAAITTRLAAAAYSTAEIADRLLGRSIAGGADGGRTVTSAFRRVRNRVRIAGGVLTAYQENDSTVDHTAAVTTAPGDPITEVDPA